MIIEQPEFNRVLAKKAFSRTVWNVLELVFWFVFDCNFTWSDDHQWIWCLEHFDKKKCCRLSETLEWLVKKVTYVIRRDYRCRRVELGCCFLRWYVWHFTFLTWNWDSLLWWMSECHLVLHSKWSVVNQDGGRSVWSQL